MKDSDKPNIILITTDQQRLDSLGCYGSDFVNTPNIDMLAENGIKFSRAYTTNPICTPARASIFNGMYPSGHGAWHVGVNVERPEKFITSILREKGYSTWNIGKMHFNAWEADSDLSVETWEAGWEKHFKDFKTPYYGFDHVETSTGHTTFGLAGHYALWLRENLGKDNTLFNSIAQCEHIFKGEAYDWEIPIKYHQSTWLAERAVEAINSANKQGQPFFMHLGFEDPHHPHCLPVELKSEIDINKIPDAHFVENELEDKPPHYKEFHTGERYSPAKNEHNPKNKKPGLAPFCDVTKEERVLSRAYYYKMVELIDRSLGKVIDELKNLDILDNTIIVFTTDHGELLGDHGLWLKGPYHYEQLLNIPLIIHWPDGIKNTGDIKGIVSTVDIAPTLMMLTGNDIPEYMDGIDMSPIIQGDSDKLREHAYIEYVDSQSELRLKTVVTEKHKLTVYHQLDYGELYDLGKDPWETKNLFTDPNYKDIKMDFMFKIIDEMEKSEKKLRSKKVSPV